MALTKTTKDVTDIPSVSVALVTDNTAGGIKTYINTADAAKANIDSPTLIGVPKAPTAAQSDNSTQIATTAFVQSVANASGASGLNLKANIDSPTLTGVPAAPTAATGNSTTQIATTAFVQTAVANVTNTVPTFSGGVGGGEGGEIHLKKPITTGLAGDVVIDVNGNVLRFFEGGGTGRGGYFDLTQLAASAGTNLLTAGSAASFAAGTQIAFFQAAAPSGWSQNTTHNNRMLRVVNGAGGGVGGAHDPTVMNQVPNHNHSFTTDGNNRGHQHWTQTGANNVGHQHWVQTGTVSSDHTHDFGANTNNTGNHQHSYAGTGYGGASGSNIGINAASVQNTSWAGDHNHYVSGTTGGIKANHTHNCWSDGINQNHSHNCWSDGENQNHTHTGWTAGNGGGNWSPMYLDMIICIKQ